MATHTKTILVDDIDGSTDDVLTCAFGLGDSHFEIDLNHEHREELEEVLSKFIDAGREVRGTKAAAGRGRQKRQSPGETYDVGAVRNWARSSGLKVSDRGRVSREVLDAYRAAQ